MSVALLPARSGFPLTGCAAWALAALLAAAPLLSLYHQPVGLAPKVGIAAFALLAVFRPSDALLAYAGLGPLATILFVLAETDVPGLHFIEAMTLALLAGWATHRVVKPHALAVSHLLCWSVAILLTATLASAVVTTAVLLAEEPGIRPALLLRALVFRDYLLSTTPLTFALQFAEGLALVLVAADTCSGNRLRRDQILRMMVFGAAGAAVFNVLRIMFVALAREHPWETFATLFATIRVNVHFADLNAAGSYFAMMVLVAAGFAARRAFALPCAMLLAAALWLSGSRTAIVAALVAGTVGALLALRSRFRVRIAAIVCVISLLVAVPLAWWRWYPQGRNERGAAALSYRILTTKAGLQLTAAHPVFGVGLGRFSRLAEPYVGVPENAHNNYVQVMAELGIPGLLLFLTAIGAALRVAWTQAGPPGPSWGLLAGLAAFLLTCLGGHPLLIPGAAYPFWTALGLAGSSYPAEEKTSRIARRAVAALALFFVVTLPFRTAAVKPRNLGFSMWQHQPDGLSYRWAGGRSTLFVPSLARAVRIPLRHGTVGPSTVEVRIFLDGREANRVLLEAGGEWRTIRLILPRGGSPALSRVDLEAGPPGALAPLDVQPTHAGGVLMVGRPVIEE